MVESKLNWDITISDDEENSSNRVLSNGTSDFIVSENIQSKKCEQLFDKFQNSFNSNFRELRKEIMYNTSKKSCTSTKNGASTSNRILRSGSSRTSSVKSNLTSNNDKNCKIYKHLLVYSIIKLHYLFSTITCDCIENVKL